MRFLIFSLVFLMFSMMFAKTSLLFCCFCIRLFQTSMLLFVSVCCYAKPLSNQYVRLNPGLQRARPLWSGASDKLIMPILPAEKKNATLNGRGCEEIVFEHLEQVASPNLDSHSQESGFDRVGTQYNTVVSVRWDNIISAVAK